MKNKLLFAVTGLALAGLAHAQSNVVLYGIADAGVLNAKSPNGTVARVVSGGQWGSRWGIKGVETLSNGMTAKFALESGYSMDTGALGQGGLIFGRRATVGLWGNFGGVELGRRDSPMTDLLVNLEPSGVSNNFGINDALTNQARGYTRRISNQVRYEAPAYKGFSGAAMYALGENNAVPGNPKIRNDTFGFNVIYSGGPLYAGIAYQRSRDDANLGTGSTAGVVTSVVPHKFRTIGASYDLAFAKVFLFGYSDKRPASALSTEVSQRMTSGGVQVPFLGNQVAALSYASIDDKTSRNADARHLSLSYMYALSTRTNLYANVGRFKTDNFVSTNVGSGFTYLSQGLIQDNGKSQGWVVGVRHFF